MGGSLTWLARPVEEVECIGFAFLDDNHEDHHVRRDESAERVATQRQGQNPLLRDFCLVGFKTRGGRVWSRSQR